MAPTFAVTPNIAIKTFGSIVLSVLAFYFLDSGKKNHDLRRMMLGLLMGLASLALFF